MTEQAQTGLDELMNRLDQKYSSLLKWPFAAWWIEMKTEFFLFAKIALPFSLLLAILSQALIIGLNHYKHRGVILGGKGLMAGGLLTAAAFGVGMVMIGQKLSTMTPDYMELFFKIYGNGLCRTGMITGVIGVLLRNYCPGRGPYLERQQMTKSTKSKVSKNKTTKNFIDQKEKGNGKKDGFIRHSLPFNSRSGRWVTDDGREPGGHEAEYEEGRAPYHMHLPFFSGLRGRLHF